MARTYTAGIVTAYGAAKQAGYTGTYEEFCEQQAGFAGNAAQVAEDRAAVEATKETFENVTVPAAVQTIQTEGATQEAAVTAKGTEQVGVVNAAGDAQTGRVQMAGAEEVTDIETAGTTQVNAVNAAGTTQVGAVNAAGTTQTGNVNDAGATQMAAIEAKGEETRESIPEDYSTLTAEVSDLKSALYNSKNADEYFGLANNSAYLDPGYSIEYSVRSTKWVSTSPIYVPENETIRVYADGFDKYVCLIAENGKNITSSTYTVTKNHCSLEFTGPKYFRLLFGRNNDADISPSDVHIISNYIEYVNQNHLDNINNEIIECFGLSNNTMYLDIGYAIDYMSVSQNSVSTMPVYVPEGKKIHVFADGFGRYAYVTAGEDKIINSTTNIKTAETVDVDFEGPLYFRLLFKNATDTPIDPSDIRIISNYAYFITPKFIYNTPQMFGAYGDGVHDDTDALNMLFASGKKEIFIPAGIYYCADDVLLDVAGNDIRGAGRNNSIIRFATGKGFTINQDQNAFRDIRFDQGGGVVCNKYHVSFYNCAFTQMDKGITLNSSYLDQFIGCYFYWNKLAILLNDDSLETVFTDCVIDNNTIGVIICGGHSGCIFTGCSIEGNRNLSTNVGCGVYICSVSSRVILSKCHFEANGSSGSSTDILIENGTVLEKATDLSDLYDEIDLLFDGDKNPVRGDVVIEDSIFVQTKYGVITGGFYANISIVRNHFTGLKNRYNKAILINGNDLTMNNIDVRMNVVLNTSGSGIDEEMLSGIKGSYVFTDIVPDILQYNTLLNGRVLLDGEPIFRYKGRISDFTGTIIYPKLLCADGVSNNCGMVNGKITNSYSNATQSIFATTDGIDKDIFTPQGAPKEFIVVTNYKSALVSTVSSGWRTIGKIQDKVFDINRYSMNDKYLYAYNDGLIFAVVILSSADVKKTKQCVGFEPTDLTLNEWRN